MGDDGKSQKLISHGFQMSALVRHHSPNPKQYFPVAGELVMRGTQRKSLQAYAIDPIGRGVMMSCWVK